MKNLKKNDIVCLFEDLSVELKVLEPLKNDTLCMFLNEKDYGEEMWFSNIDLEKKDVLILRKKIKEFEKELNEIS